MPAAAPQGGGNSDNTYDILWSIAALAAACGGIFWYLFRSDFSSIYFDDPNYMKSIY